jgi:5-methylcytosine-specific restriction endonuclease McrA
MVCFSGALPPETGVPFVNRIELAAQRARRALDLKDGAERERFEAYAADVLVAMAVGDGAARATRADLVIVCDLFAWRRGHTHPGEVCHIVGGGPIPVELPQELGRDAFLKAVLHDGVTVHTVKHFGRHLPAELRTVLDLGAVPAFKGAECVDCGSHFNLEYDHVNPVANRGETSYDNLKARCWVDHQAKTERDRQAGLLGPNAPRRRSRPMGSTAPGHQAGLLGPNPP